MLTLGNNLELLVNGKYGEENYSELLRFFRGVDLLVQSHVLRMDLTVPPELPVNGDAYIVAANAVGEWEDRDGQIARWCNRMYDPQFPAWEFHVPKRNWLVGVDNLGTSGKLVRYTGSVWEELSTGGGGGVTDHNDLSNIGTLTHDQLENYFTQLADGFGQHDVTIQELTGIIDGIVIDFANKQDKSANLDSLTALTLGDNSGKALVVNSAADGFELVTISGGGSGMLPNDTQNDPSVVSITSVAGDIQTPYSAGYTLYATTDGVGSQLYDIKSSNGDTTSTDHTTTHSSDADSSSIESVMAAKGEGGSAVSFTTNVAHDVPNNKFTANLSIVGADRINAGLATNDGFDLAMTAESGSESADYSAATAPTAGLAVSNYIKIALNGINGYIPFLSAPLQEG